MNPFQLRKRFCFWNINFKKFADHDSISYKPGLEALKVENHC